MIFGSDDDADGPHLTIDGVRIPFTMEAHVSYGPQEEDWDDEDWDENAPWMIHLPIEMQVELPYEVLHPPAAPPPAAAPPMPNHTDADPDPHPEPAAWRRSSIPLPRMPQDRDEPISVRALESLGLRETLDRWAGRGRTASVPDLPGLVFPAAADAGDPTDVDDDWHPPALGTGQPRATTGTRALDAVSAAGRIDTLHRILRSSRPVDQNAVTGGTRTAIEPVSDRQAADGSGIGLTNGHPVGSVPITKVDPDALDHGQVLAALQRGMREADQAPAVHPSYLLAAQAEEENEGRLGEPAGSFASERTAAFYNGLARLREIDPKNPQLTYVVPQHWVPTQEAVDSINKAITEALAAKQGGAPALQLKSWELFGPPGIGRAAEFDNAIARLREIDPTNPKLTSVVPDLWGPSQDAIDSINKAIVEALAAKQSGSPVARPSWRQSEKDIGADLGPEHHIQPSYKNGRVVSYGTPGSVRPDFVSPDGQSASFEVKNYNFNTNTSGLVNSVSRQALSRQADLPPGMQQRVIIDERGQSISEEQRRSIIQQIVRNSRGIVSPTSVRFKE